MEQICSISYPKSASELEDIVFLIVYILVTFCLNVFHIIHFYPATSAEEMMKKFVAWDSQQRLSFAVPFTDMKPVIYLDPFLPRIAELALSTSDRQTKVCQNTKTLQYLGCHNSLLII